MNKILKAFKNPRIAILYVLDTKIGRLLPDTSYLKLKYRLTMGKKLNLKNPQGFNEKLQWLKLYNRNSECTVMVDKYLVRQYIADKLGEEYLIPLLGVWDSPDEIDFDKLPDKFVLKCNHNSGLGMCVCKDKSKLDIENAKKELSKGLKQNYYYHGREWPYKNVPKKIIAEQFLEDETGDLVDYKFMCFNGNIECILVCCERFSDDGVKMSFFDTDWNVLPFKRKYKAVNEGFDKPVKFEKMMAFARLLSKDIPFLRVDFYEVKGNLYFGELTFYPASGFEKFIPEEWDYNLGECITLPKQIFFERRHSVK